MATCHLSEEMKHNVRDKLEEIRQKVQETVGLMENNTEGCLICEITAIGNLARELEKLSSFYHFRSYLLPHVEGLDEIAKALATLSEKGYGALIAVEKDESLESYITACNITGVSIGAAISAPLLLSIFYPGGPLHDGAVIIKKKQIVAAGCVLPLSDKKYTNEGKKIGTRHRAALGLSERTDSLVLVVSEETGQVSFALEGILHPIEVNFCDS